MDTAPLAEQLDRIEDLICSGPTELLTALEARLDRLWVSDGSRYDDRCDETMSPGDSDGGPLLGSSAATSLETTNTIEGGAAVESISSGTGSVSPEVPSVAPSATGAMSSSAQGGRPDSGLSYVGLTHPAVAALEMDDGAGIPGHASALLGGAGSEVEVDRPWSREDEIKAPAAALGAMIRGGERGDMGSHVDRGPSPDQSSVGETPSRVQGPSTEKLAARPSAAASPQLRSVPETVAVLGLVLLGVVMVVVGLLSLP